MPNFSLLQTFKNASIAKKLYFTVGIMALLIALELFTLWFANSTLSSVRAFINGEGLWSKGEKDAVNSLHKYARTGNEKDYQQFLEFMKVPLGDHKTRMQLMNPKPNIDSAREGFLEGRNHPDDVDGMIKLFTRFYSVSYIHKAIIIWTAADSVGTPMIPIAAQIHQEINSAEPSQARIGELLNQIDDINANLTVLEDDFSFTLGEGARWLENLVLRLLFCVALTVEISGLFLAISVSRSIQRGLKEIIRASKDIAKGNLRARAEIYSGDEIGTLAESFNDMTTQYEKSIADKNKANESLKDYAKKLEQSNNSLEQFAYVASHDLQEPLRNITNFANLLEDNENHNLDPKSRKYLNYIVHGAERLKVLIKDLLLFSRLGKQHMVELVNFNDAIKMALLDMELMVKEYGATIKVGHLPVLPASKTEVKMLLQNLINNAIKYSRAGVPPVVEINAEKQDNGTWLFSVKDNGIGIEPEFKERIFVIFQRLHNQDEYSGTGIGLATCKKVVELNGGTIWVESKPGEGSVFYFTFPKPGDA